MSFSLEDIKSLWENKKYGVKRLLKMLQTHSAQFCVSVAFVTGLVTDLQLGDDSSCAYSARSVSYTHLTLPTNREV